MRLLFVVLLASMMTLPADARDKRGGSNALKDAADDVKAFREAPDTPVAPTQDPFARNWGAPLPPVGKETGGPWVFVLKDKDGKEATGRYQTRDECLSVKASYERFSTGLQDLRPDMGAHLQRSFPVGVACEYRP